MATPVPFDEASVTSGLPSAEDIAIRTSALKGDAYTKAIKQIATAGQKDALALIKSTGRLFGDALVEMSREKNEKGMETLLAVGLNDGSLAFAHAYGAGAAANNAYAILALTNYVTPAVEFSGAAIAGECGSTEALDEINRRMSEQSLGEKKTDRIEAMRAAFNKAVETGHKETAAYALKAINDQPVIPAPPARKSLWQRLGF